MSKHIDTSRMPEAMPVGHGLRAPAADPPSPAARPHGIPPRHAARP